MKNKILTLVMVTVLFAVLIVSSSFILLINMQQIKLTKEELRNINYVISEFNIDDMDDLSKLDKLKINNIELRVTVINAAGDVLYDNTENKSGENDENHLSRPEIVQAFVDGEGYSTRYSSTMNTNFIYYATKINEDLVIRTSLPVNQIKLIQAENIHYYVLILLVVLLFSVVLSLRLVRIIIQPMKELEDVTYKMANGDYKTRVHIKTHDELGMLGDSFNNMADQLQRKMDEVIDKQVKLESIIKSMDSGVVAVNNNYEVISINPFAERLLGVKKNIIGKRLFDYINDYDINEFLSNEDERDKEIKVLHPIERDLRIKKSDMISGVAKIGRVITFQDITDIKRVALMRTQFVANVSHELKTPLTSIKGFAETLKYVDDEETRKKFLDIIDKEAERLTRLINDILVLSNIESGLVSEMDEFLPKSILDDVVNMVRKIAVNKGVKVEYEDTNSECILGDKDKFYQLALNLIENAVKYSKDNGNVEVKSYTKGKYYYLRITDDGIGIPEEDIPRIFERFYRVDKSRKKGGTGLGLAIVKHIVKTFNGDIKVESELGKGSVFEVSIPYY